MAALSWLKFSELLIYLNAWMSHLRWSRIGSAFFNEKTWCFPLSVQGPANCELVLSGFGFLPWDSHEWNEEVNFYLEKSPGQFNNYRYNNITICERSRLNTSDTSKGTCWNEYPHVSGTHCELVKRFLCQIRRARKEVSFRVFPCSIEHIDFSFSGEWDVGR